MGQSMELVKEDSKVIDIAKGMCICLVVLGHIASGQFVRYIYLFHLTSFVMLSGYVYDERHSQNIKSVLLYCKNKVKRLYIPFVLYNLLFLLFHNLFVYLNIYTNDVRFLINVSGKHNFLIDYVDYKDFIKSVIKIFMFGGSEQLAGASWFLRILFFVTVLYNLIIFLARRFKEEYKDYIVWGICFLSLLVGNVLWQYDILLPLNFSTLFTYLFIYAIGAYLKKVYFIDKFIRKDMLLMTVFISNVILIFGVRINLVIETAENSYTNLFVLIVYTMVGFSYVISISNFLAGWRMFSCFFRFAGKNTMPILFLHFLCFKIVTFFEVKHYKLDSYYLASFPKLYNGGIWWLLYFLIGIITPLLFVGIKNVMRAKLCKIE